MASTSVFIMARKLESLGRMDLENLPYLELWLEKDQEFEGRAVPLKGTTIGFLPQEPVLDNEQTVRENVEQAFRHIKKMIEEFNEISAKMAEPMSDDEMEKAMG